MKPVVATKSSCPGSLAIEFALASNKRPLNGYAVVSYLLEPREKGSIDILVVGGTKAFAILVEVGLQSVLIPLYHADC